MKFNIQYIKSIVGSKTFQNIGFLTLGNVISQVFALIGAFFIPKYLGVENYGVYNTVTAYVSIFSVFTFSGLNKVIIRECSRNRARAKEILESTIGLRNIFSLFATILSIIVLLFVSYEKGIKYYIIIYSITLLFTGFQTAINTIYQAFENMKVLAYIAVIRQLCRVPLAILFVYKGFGVKSLLYLDLCLQFLILLVNYQISKKLLVFNLFSRIKYVKEYFVSGINFSLIEFLNILSGRIDLVMLSFLTSPANVGLYAFSYRMVEKFLIIRKPITQSLFPLYSRKNNEILKFSVLIKHSLIIVIPMIIFILLVSYFLFPYVLLVVGKEFYGSLSVFRVLIFYLVFNYSVIPWGLAFQTSRNERYALIMASVCALLNILFNFILYKSLGIVGIAYSTLVVEATRLLLSILVANNIILKNQKYHD